MQAVLNFVHITDTHFGLTPDYAIYGQHTLPCAERLVALINDFPQQPDFVIHTGDISTDRSPQSYELAAATLARLRAPIHYVCGNHDDPALLRRFLGAPQHPGGDPNAPLDYAFEVRGERFLVLDTRGTVDPAGHLSAAQLEVLRAECIPDGPPLTVFLHYPPLAMASPWLDARMLIDNGEALHAALRPARERLRGVFYGHLHRPSQVTRDGITYTSVASTFSQFQWRPWDPQPLEDPDSSPGYSHVQYLPEWVVVNHYGFPPP